MFPTVFVIADEVKMCKIRTFKPRGSAYKYARTGDEFMTDENSNFQDVSKSLEILKLLRTTQQK